MVASAYLTVDTGIESAAPNVSRTRKLTRRRSLRRPVARFDAPGVTLSRLPSGNGKRPTRYTTGSNRMRLNHGKSAADFQWVDAGIGDIAGTPDTAWDRRLTPVYWASPERRRRFARLSVLGRVDRQ